MNPAGYEQIRARGELRDILTRSVRHLAGMPKERLFRDFEADPDGWAYGGDFVGRWLDGMAHYHRDAAVSGPGFRDNRGGRAVD